jgi:hypothetical protein
MSPGHRLSARHETARSRWFVPQRFLSHALPSHGGAQAPSPAAPAFTKGIMNDRAKAILIVTAVGAAAAALGPVSAVPHLRPDFSGEMVGAEPKSLLPVVGIWRMEAGAGKMVLAVDGGHWKEGQSPLGIAEKARVLYGARYAEFLDSVQTYPDYPYAVARDVDKFTNGEISVRFKGLSGRIDQGAGILFNLKPNGDYLVIRANCLENDLVLWTFEKGRRSSIEWVPSTPTASRQWHDLKLRIAGSTVEGVLDGKFHLHHVLPEPVSGKIGLWSKADSHMQFDQFSATSAE